MAEKHCLSGPVKPRIIIHGGAGNINRANLSSTSYKAYREALLSTLHSSSRLLSRPGANALDVATRAVALLEDNPLFNAGHGAVFTTAGTNELEASVMVSKGYRKRGVGVMKVTRVKNPIKVAREMLVRGEEADGGGAQGHVQLQGESVEKLAHEWGLEMVKPGYFWTKRRWDEHRRGLGKSTDKETYEHDRRWADSEFEVGAACPEFHDPSWDGKEYLPQGTVGCVVLDSTGMLCVATSTGGLTNKLPGRIGDTPTIGAGFFAEQWIEENPFQRPPPKSASPLSQLLSGTIGRSLQDCMPMLSSYLPLLQVDTDNDDNTPIHISSYRHGVAMSGTGNGDSFLKLAAVRTAAAMARFSFPPMPLQVAVTRMAGPDGMLQQSAEDRWHETGEGEGGIIGIEYQLGAGRVVADFNCGGMFRAWVDGEGKERMMVFRDEY